jgi:hypothetical protein
MTGTVKGPAKAGPYRVKFIVRFKIIVATMVSLISVGSGFSRTVSAQVADTHLIVVTGVEADASDGKQFHTWATSVIDAATKRGGVADANVVYLADKPDADAARITGRSTRENVEKAFGDVAGRAKPNDEVFILLMGHGSLDSRGAAFNLPGPDLMAADYARLLSRLAAQRVVFVNTASSSGGFLQPLAAPGRIIVTATKTGGEHNDTQFPEYFVEAFASEAADKNRDGRVSILEAFEYAKTKVTQAYQQKGNILTEHAMLDDGQDGKFADTLFLDSPKGRAASVATVADPALRALLEQKQGLEDQIAALKLRKTSMDPAQYDQALEKLLTDLAQKTRAIQQMDGKKEGRT